MTPPNPPLKYELARQFRKELTQPEVRLWARIKGKPEGIHFRKQHSIGPYIADFYCAAARLVIEVDGQAHNLTHVAERDEVCAAWLTAQGLEVMRINAADILRDADEAALGVLMRTRAILRA